jgi:hypothetical protein
MQAQPTDTVGAVYEPVKGLESGKHQRYAITDQQFGTSFFQYRFRCALPIEKDIELRMFQIADR